MISSRTFMVSCLMSKPLRHLEFLHEVRGCALSHWKVFKGRVRGRAVGCVIVDILVIGWWWGHRKSAPSAFWVYVLVGSIQLTSSTWGGGGFSICKTVPGYGSESCLYLWGGSKGPWVFEQLRHCFVLFGCSPLLLHCLDFLVKFTLWNSRKA